MSMALLEWTLQQLRDQTREWRNAALRLPRVGMAVSLDLLTLPQLVDILRKGVRAGLQPQYLGVELRGGAEVEPTPDLLEAFAGLKKMGLRFVLDQFGGPGSCLLQLGRLPADDVKLHPQFFRVAGREQAALAGATLAMARGMSLRTVATGIDNERQLALLEEKQCDEYQGVLAGPPLKPAAFAKKWMTAQR
jgi:EAL domain-containing protein (putative c-di-GMP-specific phosphodiesterase class I)